MNLKCAAGPPGKTSLCDHDASGSEIRARQLLRYKQECGEHVCDVCPAGKTSSGDHDASGIDAVCDATSCKANEKGVSHACTACPADRQQGQARRLWNRHLFRHTPCGEKYKVVHRVCATCPPGKPALAKPRSKCIALAGRYLLTMLRDGSPKTANIAQKYNLLVIHHATCRRWHAPIRKVEAT